MLLSICIAYMIKYTKEENKKEQDTNRGPDTFILPPRTGQAVNQVMHSNFFKLLLST